MVLNQTQQDMEYSVQNVSMGVQDISRQPITTYGRSTTVTILLTGLQIYCANIQAVQKIVNNIREYILCI